jgi:hypothetical protein
MAFERSTIVFPDGQRHGPVEWPIVLQWARENRLRGDALLIDSVTQESRAVGSFPELAAAMPASDNPYVSPPGRGSSDETVATLIPYRNAPALIAYYLGVFSFSACVPILGIVGIGLGIAALVLGIKGLRVARERPEAHGQVHAWIGIIGGGLFALIGLAIHVLLLIGLVGDWMSRR